MFNEFEEVRIKESGILGVIVDKTRKEDGRAMYIVEADKRDANGVFPLYDVFDEDIEYKNAPVVV